MTIAHVHADHAPDLLAMVDIVFRLKHRLQDDYGVRILVDDTLYRDGLICDWDPAIGTFRISLVATLHEQYHVYRGLLDLLVVGYCYGAVPASPRLRLVPSSRPAMT